MVSPSAFRRSRRSSSVLTSTVSPPGERRSICNEECHVSHSDDRRESSWHLLPGPPRQTPPDERGRRLLPTAAPFNEDGERRTDRMAGRTVVRAKGGAMSRLPQPTAGRRYAIFIGLFVVYPE